MRLRRFFAAFALALAAAPASAGPVSVSTSLGFESRYLFRGVQYSAAAVQPAISLGFKGFYGAAWANIPVEDTSPLVAPEWQEVDVTAGWGAQFGVVAVDLGVTYYTYPNRMTGLADFYEEDGDGLGASTVEPFLGVTFKAPLSPKLYVYRDFMFDTFTVQASGTHALPIAARTSLDASGALGYVVDDAGGADYLYGNAGLNLTYALSPFAAIYAGGRFGGSDLAGGSVFDDAAAGARGPSGFWWGAGLTAKF